ncbi:hypothetical protein [Streptomyces sp. NPDC046862]|uniref:hypothetical protein n=1 Tax=Streptomyces sp. NPDC046862 TaxID=3154603 RepID=UPI003454F932
MSRFSGFTSGVSSVVNARRTSAIIGSRAPKTTYTPTKAKPAHFQPPRSRRFERAALPRTETNRWACFSSRACTITRPTVVTSMKVEAAPRRP